MNGIISALEANAVIVGLIVGTITPPLVAVLQQPQFSTRQRKLLATAASVVIGFLVAASQGMLGDVDSLKSLSELVSVVGAVWAASEAAFQRLWKPSGVAGSIERSTTVGAPAEPGDDPGELETK